MAGFERVMRDGEREAGGQQDDRVEQRDPDRAHGRELFVDVRAVRRPVCGVFGPDQLRHQAAEVGYRELADVEQRAEEGEEEHHLGKDEPAHAPAERCVDLLVVKPSFGFADYRAEPAEQHHEQHANPAATIQGPAGTAFIQNAAPMPRRSSATEPTSGQYEGCGTK